MTSKSHKPRRPSEAGGANSHRSSGLSPAERERAELVATFAAYFLPVGDRWERFCRDYADLIACNDGDATATWENLGLSIADRASKLGLTMQDLEDEAFQSISDERGMR